MKGTIIYVNFSPYENAGKILDYLMENYSTILLFSFNFHRLDVHRNASRLTVYQHGKTIYYTRLYQTPTPPSLAFLLLPVRSVVIFLQLLWHTQKLKKQYGPYDTYFTVNAFTAWCGNILRKLGIVNITIFWVWDYYPPIHKNSIVKFMRWLYWLFDKPASRDTDTVVFLNKRLELLRRRRNLLPKDKRYDSIGIGTDPINKITPKHLNRIQLVFLGVIKKSQGLDLLFDAFEGTTNKHMPKLHIIGGGPDESHYRKRALISPLKVQFHGYIMDDTKVTDIINDCHIGIATYVPDKSNVSYYSDPSKIKRYLSCGLPVITTDVFAFSDEITKSGAGIVIPYQGKQLFEAITKIMKTYPQYQRRALTLAKKYFYKNLYKNLFAKRP
ncbi:hypothetical protein A2Z00_02400 [Candidatus Gottesmanbacteria bacterium RBG_13_45_10]|uniref:Glycosyl transferase family 1 domain-containing protein n=1 Tax=Candidatus Gottesmanbacteria bacterium RBG_13_45_10 TaxID=1798370 RepID=A0A1F5ZFM7_9BACT|nr:MAG: hypothetical protein A2Z00_02400 [Candidatus Gottesmanbacteria bacterium RBG_13_45_10]